jgi:hypothetical protein
MDTCRRRRGGGERCRRGCGGRAGEVKSVPGGEVGLVGFGNGEEVELFVVWSIGFFYMAWRK